MPFYIYILHSSKSNIYYVGYTDNIERRISEHNNPQRTKFTSKHLPWQLKCCFEVSDSRSGAMKVEKYIKKQKSRAYVERLINDSKERLKLLV